jgi:hypothetical protein
MTTFIRMQRLPQIMLALALVIASPSPRAQDASAERQLVIDAATAMGGLSTVGSVRTLSLRGYGHEAYQDGGSLVTTDPKLPRTF